jgi:hypothetical protein
VECLSKRRGGSNHDNSPLISGACTGPEGLVGGRAGWERDLRSGQFRVERSSTIVAKVTVRINQRFTLIVIRRAVTVSPENIPRTSATEFCKQTPGSRRMDPLRDIASGKQLVPALGAGDTLFPE